MTHQIFGTAHLQPPALTPPKYVKRLREREAKDSVTLPPELVRRLRIEGSELKILMAGPDNLDWTYLVRYSNGKTGAELASKGAELPEVLKEVVHAL